MNKFNFFGIITVIGIIATTIGSWAKITHQLYADKMITVGLYTQGIGLAALAWFAFMYLKKKNKQ